MNKYKINVSDNKYYVVYSESRENAVKKLRDAQAKRISDDIQSKIDAITNIVGKVMYGAFPRDHGGTFSYRVYPNEVGRTIALIKRAFPGIEIKKWSSNEIEIFKRSLTDSSIFDYQPKEISHSRLEAIPLQARQELQNSKNKEATLLSIEGNIEDIINAAEPSNREELKQRGSKITNDLRRQFRITDNVDRNKIEQVIKSRQFELRRDGDKIQEYIYKGNSEDKKNAFEELAKVLPANVGLGLSGDVLSVSFRDENIRDAKLTSESILEKAKSLGGQAKQNGATGVLGISITSPQRSDEFANWLEKNNIHYNSDGRQYYVEIQDSAIKDGKYVINNMNDLKRLFTNFPKGDVDISYGRSGFYYHIRPKADGKVNLGSAGYDGTFNTLKEALEWVVYNFRDLILNVNPDGSNRDSAIKDSYYTDSNIVRDSIREGETYTNRNGVQIKILGINTDVTGKKYATYRIKNDTYNHPIENVENMLKANHYTKDSNIVEDSLYNVYDIEYLNQNSVVEHWKTYANNEEEAIKNFESKFARMGLSKTSILNIVQTNKIEDSTDEDYTNSTYTNGNYTLKILNKVKPGEYGVNNAYNVEWNGNKQKLSAEGISMVIRHNKMHKISDSAIKDDLSKVENIGKFTLWQDEDTKDYYFDATISRSGKKLHPLGTKDINKAREKVKKELEWITDSNIVRDSKYAILHPTRYEFLSTGGRSWVKEDSNIIQKFNSEKEAIEFANKYTNLNCRIMKFNDSNTIKDANIIKRKIKGGIEYTLDSDGWVRAYKNGILVPESVFNVLSKHGSNGENQFVRYNSIEEYLKNTKLFDNSVFSEGTPHITKEQWNKIPKDYKTTDPATGKKQAFAGSLGIAPGGTTLLTEGKHFIIDAENKEKNWTYVMFGTTGEKKVENLTKAEAEHLLKNNKLLGYSGKIYETVRDNTNNTNKILDSDIVVARSLDELISKIKSWDGETTTNYILSPKSSGWYFDYFITMGHKYSYYAYIKKTAHGRHDNPNVDISKQNIDKTVTAKTAQELIDQVVIILK